jgi:hypothetical protein
MTPFKTVGGAHDPGHVHGGPLPGNRSGFFIHGRGRHGSDGCIVPLDPAQFRSLMDDLTKSNGGTLIVAETMSDQRLA